MNTFSITRRVEFGDTDMAGIMHFANYLRFMEAAETEFLRARGLSVAWSDTSGERFGFPRVSVGCDYEHPAKFEDVLTISVTVVRVGNRSVSYRFDFFRDGLEIAKGRITTVFCRKTPDGIESQPIPEDFRAKLEA